MCPAPSSKTTTSFQGPGTDLRLPQLSRLNIAIAIAIPVSNDGPWQNALPHRFGVTNVGDTTS